MSRKSRVQERSGVVGENLPVLDPQGDALERLAAGRPGDALPRLGHVVGAVGSALHELSVLGEELVLDPVESHRHVTAGVHVGGEGPAHVQEERLHLLPAGPDEELLAPPGRDLVGASDRDWHAGVPYAMRRRDARRRARTRGVASARRLGAGSDPGAAWPRRSPLAARGNSARIVFDFLVFFGFSPPSVTRRHSRKEHESRCIARRRTRSDETTTSTFACARAGMNAEVMVADGTRVPDGLVLPLPGRSRRLHRALAPVARRVAHRVLRRLERGGITLVEGDTIHRVGRASRDPLHVTIQVRDPRVYSSLILRGSVGAAESYLAGHWDCSDLTTLARTLAPNPRL